MQTGRCVIVGGAPIADCEMIREYFREGDHFFFCDSGLFHARKLGVRADLIVGDFDSFDRELIGSIVDEESTEIITLSPVKDDTDTGHALTLALERGFRDFLLVGMTGRRMDHSLANIYLLHRIDELGATALMIDDYSEISVLRAGQTIYIDASMPFFSLINITGTARGLSIEGAKFPLSDAEILQTENDLGISNEVLPGQKAGIYLREGKLLLIKSRRG